MTPDWWHFALLALGAYRLARLIGWDDMPLLLQARNGVIGWDAKSGVVKRSLLWHFLTCGFCLGFWVCASVYGVWLLWPHAIMYAIVPLALSAVVGLVAKNLDHA